MRPIIVPFKGLSHVWIREEMEREEGVLLFKKGNEMNYKQRFWGLYRGSGEGGRFNLFSVHRCTLKTRLKNLGYVKRKVAGR